MAATSFELAAPTRIVFGSGKIRELGGIIAGFGKRALLVTGRNPDRAGVVIETLTAAGVGVVPLSVAGEPTIALVEQGTELARRKQCEFIVGIGGGSVLDAAKAIAAMLTNAGSVLDHLEVVGRGLPLTEASAPFVAIPTTAGTGSEVTRNAVLASPDHRVKASLRSPLMLPRVALLDPELTCDLPPNLTASTGLDALTQLIEPYVCRRANPLTDALCREGMLRVARSLRTAFRDGRNLAAREDMAVASLFGGLALANAGLGAAHGFAGPIGGMFPAPHGAICAVLLPSVMSANLEALRQRDPDSEALRRYDDMARWLTDDLQASADDGVRWVAELVADLKVPKLREYGLTASGIAEVVEKSRGASSMKANPIELTREELAETLKRAI